MTAFLKLTTRPCRQVGRSWGLGCRRVARLGWEGWPDAGQAQLKRALIAVAELQHCCRSAQSVLADHQPAATLPQPAGCRGPRLTCASVTRPSSRICQQPNGRKDAVSAGLRVEAHLQSCCTLAHKGPCCGSCHAARAHLQQHVEHIGMRLLHLVKQDDRVRPPPGERRGPETVGACQKGSVAEQGTRCCAMVRPSPWPRVQT